MTLFRLNKTWWTGFSVNGQRFRQSLDTIGRPFVRLTFAEAVNRHTAMRGCQLNYRGKP